MDAHIKFSLIHPLFIRGGGNEGTLRNLLDEFHCQSISVLKYYGYKVATKKADNDMNLITQEIRDAKLKIFLRNYTSTQLLRR